jgi:hypothetical protein
MVTSDGFTPLLHVLYKFSGEDTLAARFQDAAADGVSVDFEARHNAFLFLK